MGVILFLFVLVFCRGRVEVLGRECGGVGDSYLVGLVIISKKIYNSNKMIIFYLLGFYVRWMMWFILLNFFDDLRL